MIDLVTAQIINEVEFDRSKVKLNLLPQIEEDFEQQIKQGVNSIIQYHMDDTKHESITKRFELVLETDIRDIVTDLYYTVMVKRKTSIQDIATSVMNWLPEDTLYNMLQNATDIIMLCADTDIYDVILPSEDSEDVSAMIEANFEFDDETSEYLNKTMYLPPMVCKPKELKHNYDTPLMTVSKGNAILKGNHSEYINLDLLNLLNSFELCIDTNMLRFEEVPNKEKESTISKPKDRLKKKKLFNEMKMVTKEVNAMLLELGNKFYLTWSFDKRGRVYSNGYHVNIQSTDYKKSVISLCDMHKIDIED